MSSYNSHKIKTPSVLSSLSGSRRQRKDTSVKVTKPPKRRFDVGQYFEYEGSIWCIIYMYRLAHNQGVWYHYLEEQRGVKGTIIGEIIQAIGAGETTPRVVYEAFLNEHDANQYFSDIYRSGSGDVKTTQQLLKVKQVKIDG